MAIQILGGSDYPQAGVIREMNLGYDKTNHGLYICKDGQNLLLNPESANYALQEVKVTSKDSSVDIYHVEGTPWQIFTFNSNNTNCTFRIGDLPIEMKYSAGTVQQSNPNLRLWMRTLDHDLAYNCALRTMSFFDNYNPLYKGVGNTTSWGNWGGATPLDIPTQFKTDRGFENCELLYGASGNDYVEKTVFIRVIINPDANRYPETAADPRGTDAISMFTVVYRGLPYTSGQRARSFLQFKRII